MGQTMTETLLEYQSPIAGEDGVAYKARACGKEMAGGTWQGWIEFIPVASTGNGAIRSPRETTQPNYRDLEYWATGLTPVYLEGALRRALETPPPAPSSVPPPLFDGPAPRRHRPSAGGHESVAEPDSVLDPFAAYAKGETLLRRQLGALSPWHLTNIAIEYELTDLNRESLERMPAPLLIELIVAGVRESRER